MFTTKFNFRRIFILTFIAIFLSAFLTVFVTGLYEYNFGDTKDYVAGATSILNGSVYPREATLPFFRPPGYPFVIATLWLVSGAENIVILKLFNVLLHLGSALFVYFLSKRWLISSAALFAAFIFGLNPFSLNQVSQLSTETLTGFLMLGIIFFLTSFRGKKDLILLIMFCNLLFFTRPEYFAVILPLVFWALIRRCSKKLSIKEFILLVLSFLVAIGLWGSANEKATGSFIPFTDAANYHLWMGSLEMIESNYAIFRVGEKNFTENQWSLLWSEVEKKKVEWGDNYTFGSIEDRSKLWWSAYTKRVQEIGIDSYARLLIVKGIIFWRPFLNPPSYGGALSLLSLVFLLPLTIGFFVGVAKFWRLQFAREQLLIVIFTLLVITWVHMLQLPDMRYRIPIFLPYASILFSGLLLSGQNSFSKLFKRRMRDLSPSSWIISRFWVNES